MPGAKDVITDANCLAQVTQIVNPRCKLVHKRAAGGGIDLGEKVLMLSFFMAGPDLVRWELTGNTRPYRLTIHHAQGSIVEYFDDVTAALLRQGQLEDLLVAARSGGLSAPDAKWVEVPLKERAR